MFIGCSWLFVTPWTVTLTLQAPLSTGFSRKEYCVGCHFLLQGIFLTQRSNLSLLHCRQILYWLSYEGSPWDGDRERNKDRNKSIHEMYDLTDWPLKSIPLTWSLLCEYAEYLFTFISGRTFVSSPFFLMSNTVYILSPLQTWRVTWDNSFCN